MMQDSNNDDNRDEPKKNGHLNGSSSEDNNATESDNIVSFSEIRQREKEKQRERDHAKRHKNENPPMINLPPVTKILIIANIIIFGALQLLGRDTEIWAFMNFGFIPAMFAGITDFNSLFNALSPVSHMFLHSGWLHIGMNVAMLAAFGAGVEKAYGRQRYIAFYISCGVIGAFGHALLDPSSTAPVVGASGAISGLFAAILIILQKAGGLGQGKYGLWPFIGLWCGISFLFAAMGGGLGVGNIAWAAHLGGFLGGFALMRLKYFRV
jgi:membrane associated rhomboid family serine protease